ncbi:MAG: DUF4198 domain-containing protein [Ruminococcaceae bacterium]|nr:DUF4198 domain-containing protein [Oscillospiraceae bacterium]
MKKIITTLAAVIIITALTVTALAAPKEGTSLFVSICDEEGKLALALEEIMVTDSDNDGKLTVNDALFCAHQAKYPGGADAGYKTEMTQYGLSLTKLWGADQGNAFGYYLNDGSAMSLTDEVKENDRICAFAYTDLNTFSDKYSFFNVTKLTVKENESVEITLNALSYDADFNLVTLPVKDALITVDGIATKIETDSEGKASIKLDKAGKYLISATSAEETLVPPALILEIEKEELSAPVTADPSAIALFALLGSLLAARALKNEK